jgi:LPXTG-motif cell wall-anchored protein
MGQALVPRRARGLLGVGAAVAVAASTLAFPLATSASAATTISVNAGGRSADGNVDGQSFYPGVLTIRQGDTITWRFQNAHTVNFYTPPGDPEAPGVGDGTFTGTGDPTSSGIKFPAPGNNTFSLTFASTGNFVYFCALHPGMAGLVQVTAVDSTIPAQTQAQADAQGAAELAADLAAGTAARNAFQVTTQPGASGGTQFNIANGISDSQVVPVALTATSTGGPTGAATLTLRGTTLHVDVTITGLTPGAHPQHIHQGQCNAPSPPAGAANDIIYPLPTLTANSSGVATGSADVTVTSPAIPANVWYYNVHQSDGTPVTCGNVVSHPASSLRFIPPALSIQTGDTVRWTMLDVHEVHPLFFGPAAQEPANPFSPPSGGNSVSSPSQVVVSGPQTPGSTFSLTFTGPGTYNYFCMLHDELGMVGAITVTGTVLPPTGSNNVPYAAIGAGLVGLGGLLIGVQRRFRHKTA